MIQVEKQYKYNENYVWKVDLTPKCVLSDGYLTKILLRTGVSEYLNWKPISYSFIGQIKEGFSRNYTQLKKIPTNAREALQSDLMGLFQKRRFQKFLQFVNSYDVKNPKIKSNINVFKENGFQLLQRFQLSDETINYLRSFALQSMGDYKDKLAIEVIQKIQSTLNSFGVYGETAHIYPDHGQSKITSKLITKSQENGAAYRYDEQIQNILIQKQKIVGVETSRGKYKCKKLICDPKIALKLGFKDLVKLKKKVVVGIFLIEEEALKLSGREVKNAQIVIPCSKNKSNKYDLNVLVVSWQNFVCPSGFCIVIASKITQSQNAQKQLSQVLGITSKYSAYGYRFIDVYESKSNIENLYITNGYQPSYDLEAEAENSMQIYKSITGEQLFLGNIFEAQTWESIFTFLLLTLTNSLDDDLIITVLNFFDFSAKNEQE